jgi:hypothetical protein
MSQEDLTTFYRKIFREKPHEIIRSLPQEQMFMESIPVLAAKYGLNVTADDIASACNNLDFFLENALEDDELKDFELEIIAGGAANHPTSCSTAGDGISNCVTK